MEAAVTIEKLNKSFGSTRALDGLDLEVHVGEIHGLLGPNGAGKRLTLRVLLGLLRADSGVARASRRRTLARCGAAASPAGLRARRSDPVAESHRRRGDRPARTAARRSRQKRRADLLERFELDPTKKARAYSKGNRQKVALVAALSSDVELLPARRADRGSRSPHGRGVPGVHRTSCASRAAPRCSRVTSSPRSRLWPIA